MDLLVKRVSPDSETKNKSGESAERSRRRGRRLSEREHVIKHSAALLCVKVFNHI